MYNRRNRLKLFIDRIGNIIHYMQTEKYKLNAIIISRLFICTFCLIVMIMATISFAWFNNSRNIFDESMQVDLKNPTDIVVTATVHACIGEDTNGVLYFSKTAATTNDLKKYMTLVKNNRQLLLHLHFEESDVVDSVILTAETNTSYFLGDGQHLLLASADGKGEEYDNVISSIIAFYNVNPEDTIYESNDAYKVPSLGTPYCFIDKNNYSMTNVITLTNSQTINDINIVLDYDYDLVTKVFSANLGNNYFERPDGSFLSEVIYVWDIDFKLLNG